MKAIFLLLLLGIVPFSSAFGYESYETTLDYVVFENPTVCYLEYEKAERFEDITKNSIDNWQTSLKEHTGNYDSWDIYYEFIVDDYSDDYSKLGSVDCDIFVTFYDLIHPEFEGETGIMVDTEQVLIHIYNVDEVADDKLVATLTHELGHAFGLGHYVTDQPELLEKWDNGIEIPSLMIEETPSQGIEKITELDLDMMISIYGSDGFEYDSVPNVVKEIVTELPDWTQTILTWNENGVVENKELMIAIQYMADNFYS